MDQIQRFLLHQPYTKQTKQRYKYILTCLKDWLEEEGKELKTLGIDEYLQDYLGSHNWNQNTARLHMNATRSYIKWRFGDHPLLTINLPREDSMPGRTLTQNKVEDLLATFDTSSAKGWRDLTIFSLMIETGCRANEIATLLLDHLYLEENRMLVLAKGQRWQEKIFSRDTAQVVSMWLAWRPKYVKPGVKEVFISLGGNTPGATLTKTGLQSIFRYKSKEVGYKISPHDLRRTFATLLIENGAPTRVVQKLGGWKNLREVERYTRSLHVEDIERYSPLVRRTNMSQLSPNSYPDNNN